ncbi:2'-5' RNA ligase family protein [Corynebacterium tapiri]|uniref:2'-5' RNA ligase family protein n=1 Tax=Corynebacterium tapiri TaxID=1448266 RepID=A0A5C4U7I5_9CORY|nr:2'-5' RNA ligase family protein [Corynebacterium tapiri]TNM00433.1 2'-5' RNA ligase family protein [Corynebacterium tapiri]
MTSPDNILLHLEHQHEEYIREIFRELAARGFPAQQQTPHITVTFAPQMGEKAVDKAREVLPGLIPAAFRRVGTVVFGTKSKQTVAWLLETNEELERAARQISAANPDGRGERWIPHLTMGLRIPRRQVPDYIAALDEISSPHIKELTARRAALWRPRSEELTVLAGA